MNKNGLLLILFVLFLCRNAGSSFPGISDHDAAGSDTLFIPYHTLQTDQDLDLLLKDIGNAKIVLLGESTHGTHEFYEWRAMISKRLIEEKGFNFIAIEGDWVDSWRVNQFIKGAQRDSQSAIKVLRQYDRWPSYMWANLEMMKFISWLNGYNQQHDQKIGFYGLDLYSFWEWTEHDLPVKDPVLQSAMEKIRDFFAPFDNDALKYASALREGVGSGAGVVKNFGERVREILGSKGPVNETQFRLQEQAFLAIDGERYFRSSTTDFIQALNIRDAHMAASLGRILKLYGKNTRAIVWAHNGHAGDTRYSDPGNNGYTSMGEILRNEWGQKNVYSAGFGTYKGFVTAAYAWGGSVKIQSVLPAKAGSWEALLHELNNENKLILSKDIRNINSLNKWIEFRSIGAAYPGAAIYNYSIMPRRFDAFLFIDSTTATSVISDTGISK